MKISDYSTLTFDCYGTLIDWETGLTNALAPLARQIEREMDTDEILYQFSLVDSVVQSEHPTMPYTQVLGKSHHALGRKFAVETSEEEDLAFAASIKDWPAFPDSVESLQYLKQHFKIVILSNVDREGFTHSNAHLKVEFDAIYTAEEIGSYKPSPRNFEYMLEKLKLLGISKSDILHTAQSLHHDMVTAVAMGFATCWIDRRAGQSGSGATPAVDHPPVPDMRFESLADMVAAHQAELQ